MRQLLYNQYAPYSSFPRTWLLWAAFYGRLQGSGKIKAQTETLPPFLPRLSCVMEAMLAGPMAPGWWNRPAHFPWHPESTWCQGQYLPSLNAYSASSVCLFIQQAIRLHRAKSLCSLLGLPSIWAMENSFQTSLPKPQCVGLACSCCSDARKKEYTHISRHDT